MKKKHIGVFLKVIGMSLIYSIFIAWFKNPEATLMQIFISCARFWIAAFCCLWVGYILDE